MLYWDATCLSRHGNATDGSGFFLCGIGSVEPFRETASVLVRHSDDDSTTCLIGAVGTALDQSVHLQ